MAKALVTPIPCSGLFFVIVNDFLLDLLFDLGVVGESMDSHSNMSVDWFFLFSFTA